MLPFRLVPMDLRPSARRPEFLLVFFVVGFFVLISAFASYLVLTDEAVEGYWIHNVAPCPCRT